MNVNQWRTIAATLEKGDVLKVEYVPDSGSGRRATQEMELTSEYKGWWRGVGTDGGIMWNYTTLWLGDQVYAGDRTVLLKATKSNGTHDQIYGRVTDVRTTGGRQGGPPDITGGL